MSPVPRSFLCLRFCSELEGRALEAAPVPEEHAPVLRPAKLTHSRRTGERLRSDPLARKAPDLFFFF